MSDDTLLWVSARAEDVPDDDLWLSSRERAVLAGLRFAPRRRDWRLGRWTAKRAVSAWLGSPWPVAEIVATSDGAPEAVVGGRPVPVVISLTHRSGRGVCLAGRAGTSLGCDLEALEQRSDAFRRDWFTPVEIALVEQAAPADRPLMTSLVWSAKESALKALREGLRLDTREVVVRPGEPVGNGWSTLEVDHGTRRRAFGGWWRSGHGHVLTVVARPTPISPPMPGGDPLSVGH